MSDIQKILEFYKIVEKLGLVKRDVKLSDGNFESDSSHILKVAYFAKIVFPYLQTKVDLTRMLELALVHDLVEAECGDVPLCGQQGNPQLKKQKQENELAAIKRCREMLPKVSGEKVYKLFDEYEHKTSREAKIVYALDKIEANFQACRLGDVSYWGEGANGDWYYHCVLSGETPEKTVLSELDEPLLNQLEAECLNICRLAMIKSGIRLDTPASELNSQSLPLTASLLEFMDIVEKLALVKRDNRLSDGTPETDADHIVKLCYLLLVIFPHLEKNYDYGKALLLSLFHDLPEALSGDVPLSAQIRYPELKALKKEKEEAAIKTIRNLLPPPLNQQVYELFAEYENAQTAEAELIKVLDKLESTLQSNLCRDGDVRYWAECDCGDWYYVNAITPRPKVCQLAEPVVSALEDEIIRISRANMVACGIKLPDAVTAAQ